MRALVVLLPCAAALAPYTLRTRTVLASTAAADERVSLGTLEVSSVGFGMLNLPLDKAESPDATDVFRAAVDNGVSLIDTAEAYGFGTSERLAASAASEAGAAASELAIATKFAPVPWRSGPEAVVDACRASAERLGVESIDLYQIHFPDILQPFKPLGFERRKDEEFWEGLARCHELGLAKNVGVCNYGPVMTARVHEALARRGVPLASNQINLSLLFRKQGSLATLERCRELGVRVLAYFPLANGLLAGRYTPEALPPFPKSLTMKKYVAGDAEHPDGVTPLLAALQRVAARRGKTVPQVAINWCVALGAIPIPGARNLKMARENAGAMGWRLTAEEVAELEAASDAVGFEFSSGGFKLE